MDGGGEVNQPPPKKKGIVFKKRKSDMVFIDSEPDKDGVVQLEDLSSFIVKQDKLHIFENDRDGSLVWDRRFPFNVVADEVVECISDISRVDEVGDIGVDQFLQVLGFRLAFIGHSQEKKHKKAVLETAEDVVLREQLSSKETALTELKKKFSDVEKER
ncbi:uncharacterized protein LOC110269575 [Arachis ipaensis]|uniref:uncharacterized protein LOC110269575 n=1 Tax=Arachis ipaensis TaxID=130454 RepID=UPI000A2B1933|nr:uncharacterized protein LOC110269575 [Arachis ipaensis]XP_025641071.1 uncharacterized protein LOC112735785 [Arachis hypogaea]QHN99938.1 uncharacterized protein DS421_13g402180 [Arachis hypogaea]